MLYYYHHQLCFFFTGVAGCAGVAGSATGCRRRDRRCSVQKNSTPTSTPQANATNTATDAGAVTCHTIRCTPTGSVFCTANSTSNRAAPQATITRTDMNAPFLVSRLLIMTPACNSDAAFFRLPALPAVTSC